MPKKFTIANTKATAAKERKAAARDKVTENIQKEIEEANWKDEDKLLKKKQERREKHEQKKHEAAERKAKAKALLEEEMSSLKITSKILPKVTRADIDKKIMDSKYKCGNSKANLLLEENLNRIGCEGVARNVDEAISLLDGKEKDVDRHPEKRRKATYLTFEEKRLTELKAKNPNLRLSQLKQIIFKEWQKSPENPMNCA